jgi:uncharacterized low-complexity protein
MNHKSLSLTLGGAIAASITLAPVVNAAENPFAMQALSASTQVAEAGGKMKDGKCGEGKCGANKMKEGGCSASKMKEGGCSGAKMKEGGCSASKMKEGGCSGSMKTDETAPSAP